MFFLFLSCVYLLGSIRKILNFAGTKFANLVTRQITLVPFFTESNTREFYFPSSNIASQNCDSDNFNPSEYSSIHLTPYCPAFILKYRDPHVLTERLYQEKTSSYTKDWPKKIRNSLSFKSWHFLLSPPVRNRITMKAGYKKQLISHR